MLHCDYMLLSNINISRKSMCRIPQKTVNSDYRRGVENILQCCFIRDSEKKKHKDRNICHEQLRGK